MNQLKKPNQDQFFYQNRWVSKENFRVFVYNINGQKLVNSYKEYMDLITSGEWFSSKDDVKIKNTRKVKDGSNS